MLVLYVGTSGVSSIAACLESTLQSKKQRAGQAAMAAALARCCGHSVSFSVSSFAARAAVRGITATPPAYFSSSSSSSSWRLRARKQRIRSQSPHNLSRRNNNNNVDTAAEISKAKEILGVMPQAHNEAGPTKSENGTENEVNSARQGSVSTSERARRKYYEKRRRRMFGESSDGDRERKQRDEFVELKPEIVHFRSFFEKEQELYFYDAFCWPWQKDKHYRMIRQLEQKYFPDQGIEKFFIDDNNDDLRRHDSAKTGARSKTSSKLIPQAPMQHAASAANDDDDKDVDVDFGAASKDMQRFVKSLGKPALAESMPYFLSKKCDLPARWDGPTGTMLLIDKPKGWTSFTVCGKLRRLIKVQKVGHAGTLDPMATGLLIVCVGKATKQLQSFQSMIKVYSGVFRLGEATSTWDADSPVIERKPWEHITDNDIDKVVTSFQGEIWQVPPMFSAIKIGGEKMYDKARRGETIDLPPRKVCIYDFDVQRSLDDRQNLIFKVTCSKGTYVRSLCADFGRALGSCAYLTELRRDQIGEYSVEDAWKFSDLENEIVKNYL